jgi:hypothetical protein
MRGRWRGRSAAPSFSPSQVGRRARARTAGVSRWPRREREPAFAGASAIGADHKSGNRGCAALLVCGRHLENLMITAPSKGEG